jgi:hypothetical protein
MIASAYNYRPGTIVASGKSTRVDLRNTPLKGQLFLEVPVQNKPIPQVILEQAKRFNITIRDEAGKVYR